jgi:hypothetical protein
MPGIALLLAMTALTVKEDGAELRASCEKGDRVIARVPAGVKATARFAINGCYSVEVQVEGRQVRGFLPGAMLDGVEVWELARRGAPSIDTPGGGGGVAAGAGRGGSATAAQLLAENRPGEALALAERALAVAPKDPQILAFAGVAAYRNDMAARAAGYLRDALAIRPDAAVAKLLERIEREQKADRTGEPLHSTRFLFRFDPGILPRETARTLLGTLEQEYTRISFELGCRNAERLAVIIQTRDDYMQATGAAEWSGGQFDGRIRVPLPEGDGAGPEVRRTLAHELVHACLAATGTWPAWLHEGLAQRLSGETLGAARRAAIRAAAKAGTVPKLGEFSKSWSRMNGANAALAYATSLYAVELFYEHHAAFGIRNLLRSPERLESVMADLDRRIGE